jgi:hypothetical protein
VEEHQGSTSTADGHFEMPPIVVYANVLREVKPISRADCQHLYNLVRRSEWPAVLGDFIACLKSMGLEIDDAK